LLAFGVYTLLIGFADAVTRSRTFSPVLRDGFVYFGSEGNRWQTAGFFKRVDQTRQLSDSMLKIRLS
jgi:hypothetical protein